MKRKIPLICLVVAFFISLFGLAVFNAVASGKLSVGKIYEDTTWQHRYITIEIDGWQSEENVHYAFNSESDYAEIYKHVYLDGKSAYDYNVEYGKNFRTNRHPQTKVEYKEGESYVGDYLYPIYLSYAQDPFKNKGLVVMVSVNASRNGENPLQKFNNEDSFVSIEIDGDFEFYNGVSFEENVSIYRSMKVWNTSVQIDGKAPIVEITLPKKEGGYYVVDATFNATSPSSLISEEIVEVNSAEYGKFYLYEKTASQILSENKVVDPIKIFKVNNGNKVAYRFMINENLTSADGGVKTIVNDLGERAISYLTIGFAKDLDINGEVSPYNTTALFGRQEWIIETAEYDFKEISPSSFSMGDYYGEEDGTVRFVIKADRYLGTEHGLYSIASTVNWQRKYPSTMGSLYKEDGLFDLTLSQMIDSGVRRSILEKIEISADFENGGRMDNVSLGELVARVTSPADWDAQIFVGYDTYEKKSLEIRFAGSKFNKLKINQKNVKITIKKGLKFMSGYEVSDDVSFTFVDFGEIENAAKESIINVTKINETDGYYYFDVLTNITTDEVNGIERDYTDYFKNYIYFNGKKASLIHLSNYKIHLLSVLNKTENVSKYALRIYIKTGLSKSNGLLYSMGSMTNGQPHFGVFEVDLKNSLSIGGTYIDYNYNLLLVSNDWTLSCDAKTDWKVLDADDLVNGGTTFETDKALFHVKTPVNTAFDSHLNTIRNIQATSTWQDTYRSGGHMGSTSVVTERVVDYMRINGVKTSVLKSVYIKGYLINGHIEDWVSLAELLNVENNPAHADCSIVVYFDPSSKESGIAFAFRVGNLPNSLYSADSQVSIKLAKGFKTNSGYELNADAVFDFNQESDKVSSRLEIEDDRLSIEKVGSVYKFALTLQKSGNFNKNVNYSVDLEKVSVNGVKLSTVDGVYARWAFSGFYVLVFEMPENSDLKIVNEHLQYSGNKILLEKGLAMPDGSMLERTYVVSRYATESLVEVIDNIEYQPIEIQNIETWFVYEPRTGAITNWGVHISFTEEITGQTLYYISCPEEFRRTEVEKTNGNGGIIFYEPTLARAVIVGGYKTSFLDGLLINGVSVGEWLSRDGINKNTAINVHYGQRDKKTISIGFDINSEIQTTMAYFRISEEFKLTFKEGLKFPSGKSLQSEQVYCLKDGKWQKEVGDDAAVYYDGSKVENGQVIETRNQINLNGIYVSGNQKFTVSYEEIVGGAKISVLLESGEKTEFTVKKTELSVYLHAKDVKNKGAVLAIAISVPLVLVGTSAIVIVMIKKKRRAQ